MTITDLLPAERAGVALWDDVVGQDGAVAMLRSSVAEPVHAYLLVGPHGAGSRALARAFAAALMGRGLTDDAAARQASLVLAQDHPDVFEFDPEGASLRESEVERILDFALRSPIEGGAKVLILDGFDRVSSQAPKLLKSIEEPSDGTWFLILAEDVTEDLVTIASRCVRLDLGPVPEELVAERLRAEGIEPARAVEAAAAAAGDLDRARLLATDDRLALRREAWRSVPDRLDGTGARAVETADDLLAMIDDAMAPLLARQELEVEALDELVRVRGERGSGRKDLEAKHKREVRRYRTDQIRAGLADLSHRYRDEFVTTGSPGATEALAALSRTGADLVRNPNERLQLVALFGRLARSGRPRS
ncbi:MAG: hypothetical protein FGM58_01330 [Acidimicrobiia bacterium]|nr:hypothetical protein [Acidimicrobiia bacterium]